MALLIRELHKPNPFEKRPNKFFWPMNWRQAAFWRNQFIPVVSTVNYYSVNGFSSRIER